MKTLILVFTLILIGTSSIASETHSEIIYKNNKVISNINKLNLRFYTFNINLMNDRSLFEMFHDSKNSSNFEIVQITIFTNDYTFYRIAYIEKNRINCAGCHY